MYVSVGLMNRDPKVWAEVPKAVRDKMEGTLDHMGERAINVGLLDQRLERYFPRRVKDMTKLSAFLLQKQDEKGPIGTALKALADKKGLTVDQLDHADKVTAVSDMLSSGQVRTLPRPGSTKDRSIYKVTPETFAFYMSPPEALQSHIFEMNEKIGMRELVGGSPRKKRVQSLVTLGKKIEGTQDKAKREELLGEWDRKNEELVSLETDLSEGLSALILKHMGGKTEEEQRRVFDALDARMRQKGASGVIDGMRNVGYAMTMGQFTSSITQLGDIPIIFYKYGFSKSTLDAIVEGFSNVAKVAMGKEVPSSLVEYADFTNALKEYSTGSFGAKGLETIFKYSGLKYMDLFGKEANMLAAMKYYQKGRNSAKFMKKYESFFGAETKQVLRDIKLGKRNQNVMIAMLAELSEFQPISLAQNSEANLKAGNWRVLWSLKSFTLRAVSGSIREGHKEWSQGNVAKGVLQVASILLLFSMAGAGTDDLKDLLRGRVSTATATEKVMDNLMQLLLVPRFTVDKGMQQDGLVSGIIHNQIPPLRYADNIVADVTALLGGEKDFKYKSLDMAPVVGNLLRSNMSAGQTTSKQILAKSINERVKDNKKNGRGAFSGGVSGWIREYNEGLTGKERKTDRDIRKVYKEAK